MTTRAGKNVERHGNVLVEGYIRCQTSSARYRNDMSQFSQNPLTLLAARLCTKVIFAVVNLLDAYSRALPSSAGRQRFRLGNQGLRSPAAGSGRNLASGTSDCGAV
jgi:hypothetical protein